MAYIEWGIWILAALLTLFMFVTWLAKRPEYASGQFYNTDEVVALKAIPRIFIVETIILIGILFIDVSKLHLAWICPIVYVFIMLIISKRFVDREK